MSVPFNNRVFWWAWCLLLMPWSVQATTFVVPSDAQLADRSSLVVEAEVTAIDHAHVGHWPAIDYQINVVDSLKGVAPGDILVVRVPGGVRPDGTGLHVRGMPDLTIGTRTILFLQPRAGGTFALTELMLGAFVISDVDGRRVAHRPLDGAHAVAPNAPHTKAAPAADTARDVERFRDWLRDHARGDFRAPDYVLPRDVLPRDVLPRDVLPRHVLPDGGSPPLTKFAIFVSDSRPPPLGCGEDGGHGIRWFDFSAGLAVPWARHERGLGGLDDVDPGGVNAFAQALAAWSDAVPVIDLQDAGTTSADGGLRVDDGTNTVLFDDPFDELPGSFEGTGLLALGGAWFRCDQRATYAGQTYHVAFEGDIVLQDGIESFFASSIDPAAAAAELLGHELGHTLGLDHSSFGDALMFPAIHDDGRGAALDGDDQRAATLLYGLDSSPPGPPPAMPTDVVATLNGPHTVTLTWQDSGGSAAIRIERRLEDGRFAGLATVGGVDRYVDTGLLGGSTYGYRLQALGVTGPSDLTDEIRVETGGTLEPAAPTNLLAAPLSAGSVVLTWQDNATNELFYRVDLEIDGIWTELSQVVLLPDTRRVALGGLVADTRYRFRVRADGVAGSSPPSNPFTVATFPPDAACITSGDTLCLLNGRFAVRARYRNQYDNGTEGTGSAVASTNKTGLFWFFSATNIELIVKMIDGSAINGHAWVFIGGLSDLEYWVEITDTALGTVRTYHNPPGALCGSSDNNAFPLVAPPANQVPAEPFDASATAATAATAATVKVLDETPSGDVPAAERPGPFRSGSRGTVHRLPAIPATPDEPGTCVPDDGTLCLLDRRFAVTVDFRNQHSGGNMGSGHAIRGSNRSGFLWFFSPESTELVVKMLDGTATNGHYWLFFGALSDVEYTVHARDTVTGVVRSYANAPGDLCGRADARAFAALADDDPP